MTSWSIPDERARAFLSRLLSFDTTAGNERAAQDWLESTFDDWGFDVYTWTADPDRLAAHPSFPDDPTEIETADRPSVGAVLELGDPDAGRTIVLNGHVDVVPVHRERWATDPFEPTWNDDDLTARGAADMKAGLTACAFAARALADADVDGRIVVESVAGEEEGGIGAAAAALDNPYPFERDAAIVAEPTNGRLVTATQGSVMKRLHIDGRSAHAATRWRGESVLPHFERIRRAFEALETERGDEITHPLYADFPIPVPVNCGVVNAGRWASSVPSSLDAEFRIGVAPGETVAAVEAAFQDRLDELVADDPWLAENPPTFERFSIQFEPGEVDPDAPIVAAMQDAMAAAGFDDVAPRGETYGADNRHYVAAGIPTVLFGPGTIEEAHAPNETIHWPDVPRASAVIADAAYRFLS